MSFEKQLPPSSDVVYFYAERIGTMSQEELSEEVISALCLLTCSSLVFLRVTDLPKGNLHYLNRVCLVMSNGIVFTYVCPGLGKDICLKLHICKRSERELLDTLPTDKNMEIHVHDIPCQPNGIIPKTVANAIETMKDYVVRVSCNNNEAFQLMSVAKYKELFAKNKSGLFKIVK